MAQVQVIPACVALIGLVLFVLGTKRPKFAICSTPGIVMFAFGLLVVLEHVGGRFWHF